MFSFNYFQPSAQTVNSLTRLGFILAISLTVTEGQEWVAPAGWERPAALEGVDIEAHPCQVYCHEPIYRRALENLLNHEVLGQMASQILEYCAKGIIEACASATGMQACLPNASDDAIVQFQLRHMAEAAQYFPPRPR